MLTRIFATSKPLNFVWVSLFLLLTLGLDWFNNRGFSLEPLPLLEFVVILGLLIFSVLLVDFIVRKNDLSQKNSFVVLYYGLYLSLLPIATIGIEGVAAHVLVLLAVRRVISLQSLKSVKKKIFDAAFWIAIAALLWVAAGGFILFILFGILLFAANDYRNWIVPIFGVLTVWIIYFTAYWMITDQMPSSTFLTDWKLDFSEWTAIKTAWIPLLFLVLSCLLAPIYWFGFRKIMLVRKRRQLLIVILAIICWLVTFFIQPIQTGTLIFLMFPLGVMAASLMEKNSKRPITELLLWVFLLLPIAAKTVI